MRSICVLAFLSLVVSGCLAMVPNDMRVSGYNGVNSPEGFWVVEFERASGEAGADFQSSPAAFKQCVGREVVKLSPSDLTSAIDRFLRDQNVGNYKPLVPLVKRFASGYEETYGIKPGIKAGEICATPENVFDGITDVNSFWYREVKPLNKDKPDAYSRCLAEELTRVTDSDLKAAILAFVADKSESNYRKASAALAPFKVAFEKERGLSLGDYTTAICRQKLGL